MLFISHRGNLISPHPKKENHPDYIEEALNSGLVDGVEIDVWYDGVSFYLGHDKPLYDISESFLEDERLWCHAKNFDALGIMMHNDNIRCFYHNNDMYTFTNKGDLWIHPMCTKHNLYGIKVYYDEYKNFSSEIIDITKWDIQSEFSGLKGICTDYIIQYKDLLKDV